MWWFAERVPHVEKHIRVVHIRYKPTHKTVATRMNLCLSKCRGLLKACWKTQTCRTSTRRTGASWTRTHTRTHTHAHTHTETQTHVCWCSTMIKHTYTHTNIHMRMHTHVHTDTHICTHSRTHSQSLVRSITMQAQVCTLKPSLPHFSLPHLWTSTTTLLLHSKECHQKCVKHWRLRSAASLPSCHWENIM